MNTIVNLLDKDRKTILKGIILGIVSGLLNFAFITFLNNTIAWLIGGEYEQFNLGYTIGFCLIIFGFIWSRRELSFIVIRLSQNLFWRLRVEMLDMILQSNHEQVNKRKEKVQSALLNDVGILTGASLSVIEFITSSVVVISCLIYMSVLSVPLFLTTLAVAIVGVGVYQLGSGKNNKQFAVSRKLEDGFMKYFISILDGFKEIHMNGKKGKAILDKKIKPIAKDAYKNNIQAFVGFLNLQITGQVLFYILISSILLIFSVTFEIEKITVVNFIFVLLYLLGAIETIMVLLPSLARAKISLNHLSELKGELENEERRDFENVRTIQKQEFQYIKAKDICFTYFNDEGKESFHIGPLQMELQAGEVTFIYGGNGSGKTTFVHALLGILKPTDGAIEYNGKELTDADYEEYKTLFSVVFNEFYLFDEFYGNEDFDRERAAEYLKLFEIEDKIAVTEKGFSATALSTGQRKRLALIACLLENKPVLVLDEWAADQDPYFRKKFYEEIIPMIKNQGVSIIAITHDDAYYHCADKLVKMEDGSLLDETSNIQNKKQFKINEN
ncbi:MAG: cyclic peptide export ABC transporter [Crocinitomix sp.]|nr:cyclic peptide export ABC transporter [Crocinitomix sp.]